MKNNFIALDFETSYGKIPCSIGIVEFIDGIPVRKYHSLIKPYQLKFSQINSNIHGIRLEHVINKREFDIVWDEVMHLFDNRIVVCHNSSFDISVLNYALEIYDLPKPNFISHCTYMMSQRCLDLESYKLPSIVKHFNFDQYNHHNALEDALLCGQIFYKLCDEYSEEIKEEKTIKRSVKRTNTYHEFLKINLIPKTILNPYVWSVSDRLSGCKIVISGVFEKFSRDDLKKAIEDNGGKVGSSISAKTNYVVAGDNMGPAKLEKANQLGVKIISEDEFIGLIE